MTFSFYVHFQIKLNLFYKRGFRVLEINEWKDRLQLKDIEKQNPELPFFQIEKKTSLEYYYGHYKLLINISSMAIIRLPLFSLLFPCKKFHHLSQIALVHLPKITLN